MIIIHNVIYLLERNSTGGRNDLDVANMGLNRMTVSQKLRLTLLAMDVRTAMMLRAFVMAASWTG